MNRETKLCPFCKEEILKTAIKCKHCNEWLEDKETVLMKKDTTIIEAFAPKFEIIEKIAHGGEATVYKARKKNLDSIVALKIFNKNALDDDVNKSSISEARISAQLIHPNIIRVYDVDELLGYPYIEMEYIEGGTLREIIKKRGLFSDQEAIDIIKQILKGLSYAHKKKVIHRDIKSSNIMFRDGLPLLMDFGIAKKVEGTMHTELGQVKGTPQYMSPEQAQGGKIDARSDIYSIGILIFEMLTGQVPFDADTPYGIIHKHISEPPQKPRSINSDITLSLEKLILKALSKNPRFRHKSCEEMIEALDLLETGNGEKKPKKPKNKKMKWPEIPIFKLNKNSNILMYILIISILIVSLIIIKPSFSNFNFGKMVYVGEGTFSMGSTKGEPDERPANNIKLDGFYIKKNEVTVKEFNIFTKRSGYKTVPEKTGGGYRYINGNWSQEKNCTWRSPGFHQTKNNPVVCVTFLDAVKYCNWLSQKEGLSKCYEIKGDVIIWYTNRNGYRLPTEAEWEFAAKGGKQSEQFIFSGSNGINKVAIFNGNSNTRTQPVKTKKSNEIGLYDMTGNVNEWCWDWYDDKSYQNLVRINNPHGPAKGENRVIRGGSWGYKAGDCRISNRAKCDPKEAYWDIGFRVCRNNDNK